MISVVTPHEAAQTDSYMINEMGIPGLVLMEQASSEVAGVVMSLCPKAPVKVICGKGNNGGDGIAAARILLAHGFSVSLGVTTEEYSGDAAVNFEFFKRSGNYTLITEENCAGFFSPETDVIIDAIFGTGLARAPKGLYEKLISLINAHPARVVSVDIPSGVFGATGFCEAAVKADYTVTFQHPKIGHFIYPGAAHTGELTIKKIGVDAGAIRPSVFHIDEITLPKRQRNTNKGSYGRLMLVCGSGRYSGAAILATRAALKTGAGLVTTLTDSVTAMALKAAVPEAMAYDLGKEPPYNIEAMREMIADNHFIIGCGLSADERLKEEVFALAALPNKKVIDADALNIIASDISILKNNNCVITPHPGEFSRLTGLSVKEILTDPLGHAREFAERMNITVLLKGASTVITDGSQSFIVTAGAPSMAKGGSGDVLSGVIGALIAQGYPITQAAYTGAYLAGKAGEAANRLLGDYAPLASDTIDNLLNEE